MAIFKMGRNKMIDIEKAEKAFREYIKAYNPEDEKIKIKIGHIKRVEEQSKWIATSLGLDEENILLAKLIGLLHDIGRFEQVRRFHTFLDKISVNHAEEGNRVLFEQGLIREFVADPQYDDIIRKAIGNHNKLQIEDGLSERELLHAKIIRDADKSDIFPTILATGLQGNIAFSDRDTSKETITPVVFEKFMRQEPISYGEIQTNIDHMVIWVTYIYDINFGVTLQKIKEGNYISRILHMTDYEDENTKEKIKQIENKANQDIEEMIKKDE